MIHDHKRQATDTEVIHVQLAICVSWKSVAIEVSCLEKNLNSQVLVLYSQKNPIQAHTIFSCIFKKKKAILIRSHKKNILTHTNLIHIHKKKLKTDNFDLYTQGNDLKAQITIMEMNR